MAFPPLVPMSYCCSKCNWEKEVQSDALELFPCPKCGSEVVIKQKKTSKHWLFKLFS